MSIVCGDITHDPFLARNMSKNPFFAVFIRAYFTLGIWGMW
ncbi:hypothetical protein Q7O_003413 [Pectobacterium carotovorum subsp. carotovorum PCCS1]|nr:hypothetical protein [Pectobacterium carotovorum subsp. carotovorum PCCS1]